MKQCRAKTICADFDEQLDIAERLYGTHIYFQFQEKDVKRVVQEATIYTEKEKARVREIIYAQMRKYKYLVGDKVK